jgi:group I intron endonuclease
MSSIYSIYCITNSVTNKKYIGFTKRSPEKRFNAHISEANRNLYTMYLHNSIRKYGKEYFRVETLMTNLTYEQATKSETEYILEMNTIQPFGYNEHQGGKGGCQNPSVELRRKLSEARKGKEPWNKGKTGKQTAWNAGFNKPLDDRIAKYSEKISISLKGKPKSDEHKRKIRESLRKSKSYCGVDTFGKIHHIDSIVEFSKQHGVNSTCIYRCIRENSVLKKTVLRGWSFYKADPLFNRVESIPQTTIT